GLITLTELLLLGVGLCALQLVCALIFNPALLPLLLALWLYYACMTKEFFAPAWLKKHMFIYMFSHMLIMPLLDMYAAACDFLPTEGYIFMVSMIWFVLSSFFDGVVVELCRKLRAPGDEEKGVQTYSAMWGRGRSAAVVIVAMVLSLVSTGVATSQIGGFHIAVPVLSAVCLLCWIPLARYLQNPTTKRAAALELMSGVWTVADYTCLGVLPLIFLAG
ncbi:MAG: hypothetical protein LBH21_01800, partial [Gracilibacteraceae bacterium]|nr:hypothetical protein [Gracilibacteraceae bacterium]